MYLYTYTSSYFKCYSEIRSKCILIIFSLCSFSILLFLSLSLAFFTFIEHHLYLNSEHSKIHYGTLCFFALQSLNNSIIEIECKPCEHKIKKKQVSKGKRKKYFKRCHIDLTKNIIYERIFYFKSKYFIRTGCRGCHWVEIGCMKSKVVKDLT